MPYSISSIQAPIDDSMKAFEGKFKSFMKTKVMLLDTIMHYIVQRKGKQMRPMFVFLTAGCMGEISEIRITEEDSFPSTPFGRIKSPF
jgi:octaprenyl-diphosphate synthase